MTTNYIKSIIFLPSEDLSLSDECKRHLGAAKSKEWLAVGRALGELSLLNMFLVDALRKDKIEMKNPSVPQIYIDLTLTPKPAPEIAKKYLSAEVYCEPWKILEIPRNPKSYGEYAIGIWTKALDVFTPHTDIPAKFINKKIDDFVEQDYAYKWSSKTTPIYGSKAKAIFHTSVSCVSTEIWLELAYRKHTLFQCKIQETSDQYYNFAFDERRVAVQNGKLIVFGERPVFGKFILSEATIPLEKLPDIFMKTLV